MKIEIARSFFLWCALINYGLLMVWFLSFRFGHDRIMQAQCKWFRLSGEQFDAMHYGGMGIYKMGIFLFNLAPFLALCIVG